MSDEFKTLEESVNAAFRAQWTSFFGVAAAIVVKNGRVELACAVEDVVVDVVVVEPRVNVWFSSCAVASTSRDRNISRAGKSYYSLGPDEVFLLPTVRHHCHVAKQY